MLQRGQKHSSCSHRDAPHALGHDPDREANADSRRDDE